MFLDSFNTTQDAQLLQDLFKSTASSVVPLLIMESFTMGVLCAYVPLASYLLWVKAHPFPRAPFTAILWALLATIITHWALSLRQLDSTLAGLSLGISLAHGSSNNAGATLNNNFHLAAFTHSFYGEGWQSLLPLVTETVLCGLSSSLFAIVAYTNFRHSRSHWRSCFALIIPVMAFLMYTLSLTHWAVSLRSFIAMARSAATGINAHGSLATNVNASDAGLLGLIYMNAVMSDSIVLWRMCVVWERAWPVCAFAAALLLATLGVNLANLVLIVRALASHDTSSASGTQHGAFESISIYGENNTGLVIAFLFLALASNLSATMLVALKAWLNRTRLTKAFRSDAPRTLVQRVLELLVESGVVYTALWILCGFRVFRFIRTGAAVADASGRSGTVVNHLVAAMAQMTSIYPLMVFILVALDKIHHSRGPRTLRTDDLPRQRDHTVTVAFEIDVERSMAQRSFSAHPTAAPQPADNYLPGMDDTKFPGSQD